MALTSDTSMYRSTVDVSRSEVDLRGEMANTLDGSFPEIAKGRYGMLRRMRRDSNDEKIACDCVHPVTREPDQDTFCPICHGEGWLWDETLLVFYSRVLLSDSADNEAVVFYLKHDTVIDKKDKIIEFVLDIEGEIVEPRARNAIYRINILVTFRSDEGRVEYLQASCEKDNVKFLNAPTS